MSHATKVTASVKIVDSRTTYLYKQPGKSESLQTVGTQDLCSRCVNFHPPVWRLHWPNFVKMAGLSDEEQEFRIEGSAASRREFVFVAGRGLLPEGGLAECDPVENTKVMMAEVEDGDMDRYGLYTWRSAVALARWVWYNRRKVCGQAVCELGAGTALPGLLAAKCGASPTYLTDRADAPAVLKNCAAGCALNGLAEPAVKVRALDWGYFDDFDMLPPFDLILGADVLYEPNEFEDAIATVAVLLRLGSPGATFVTTVQNRSPDRLLAHLMQRHGLSSVEIPLRAVYHESEQDEADIENEVIHLLVLTLCG